MHKNNQFYRYKRKVVNLKEVKYLKYEMFTLTNIFDLNILTWYIVCTIVQYNYMKKTRQSERSLVHLSPGIYVWMGPETLVNTESVNNGRSWNSTKIRH